MFGLLVPTVQPLVGRKSGGGWELSSWAEGTEHDLRSSTFVHANPHELGRGLGMGPVPSSSRALCNLPSHLQPPSTLFSSQHSHPLHHTMFDPPPQPLPLPPRFNTPEAYITSLLHFTQTPLFQTLCGGVHILDFFTRDPPDDIYTKILPADWRDYFERLTIDQVLDVLLRREDVNTNNTATTTNNTTTTTEEPQIPPSLAEFIYNVRSHMLVREFRPRWAGSEEEVDGARKLRKQRRRGEVLGEEEEVLRRLTVGMKPKKMHEVRGCEYRGWIEMGEPLCYCCAALVPVAVAVVVVVCVGVGGMYIYLNYILLHLHLYLTTITISIPCLHPSVCISLPPSSKRPTYIPPTSPL